MKKLFPYLIASFLFVIIPFLSNAQCHLNVLYSNNPTCGTPNNGGVAVTCIGSMGTVAYTINPGGITNNTGVFNGLTMNVYTISATDSFGCSSSITWTVYAASPLHITSVQQHPCDMYNVEIMGSGGSGIYTISTSPFAPTNGKRAMLNTAGIYTVTMTDAAGCSTTSAYNYVIPTTGPVMNQVVTNSSCVLLNGSGQACANSTGGVPPYTYWLVGPDSTITSTTGCFYNLSFGDYVLHTEDAQGCKDSTNVKIIQANPTLLGNSGPPPSSCNSSDGEICLYNILAATPPLTFTLNGGTPQSAPCFNSLTAGVYTLSITDANNCTGTYLYNLQAPQIIPSMGYSYPTCGMSNGSLGVYSLSGGLAPYEYSLNGGPFQTSFMFNALGVGFYTVTVKDANNCSISALGEVRNLPFLNTPNITILTCTTMGSFSVTSSGAVLPVTYTLLPTGISNTTGNFPNLSSGNYTVTAIDGAGCVDYTTFVLTNFQNFSGTPTYSSIPGSITITPPPGMTPPYQFNVSGGAYQSSGTFTNLCTGYYNFNVKDANGCIASVGASTTSLNTFPGYTITADIINSDCPVYTNGEVAINISPSGTFYYCPTYLPTLYCGLTNPEFKHLNAGNYTFNIYNSANQCVTKTYTVNVDNYNCGEIHGTVFIDQNTNCINNTNDSKIANQQIILTPSGDVTYSGSTGNYSFQHVPYSTNILFQTQQWFNQFSTCGNFIPLHISSSSASFHQDLSDTLITPSCDISTWVNALQNFVPGKSTKLKLVVHNPNPFIQATGNVVFTLDPLIVYDAASITPSNITGNSFTWNFSNVIGDFVVNLDVHTPFGVSLNSLTNSCSQATLTSMTDVVQGNNNFCLNLYPTNSTNQTNKINTPQGYDSSNHFIEKSDSLLTYTINFQNNGFSTVRKVKILDTLSSKLEIFKFKVLNASHPYEIRVINNHILEFTFNNIMLPDSSSNEPDSHGFITYQIEQKGNNRYGDKIKNKASIYFDKSLPKQTNECFNTIYNKIDGVFDYHQTQDLFFLHPVPSDKYVNINFNSNFNGELIITDISGHKVFNQKISGEHLYRISTDTFAEGFYIAQFKSSLGISTAKFVIKH